MKRYCLKPKAKEAIKDQSRVLFFLFIILSAFIGLIVFPVVILDARQIGLSEWYFVTCGFFAWGGLLSLLAINFKRWLQSNIVEC